MNFQNSLLLDSWTIKLFVFLHSFYENILKIYIYSNIKTFVTYLVYIYIYEISLKHEHTHVVTDKYGKVKFRKRKEHFQFLKEVHNYLFRTLESSYTPELSTFHFLEAM